MESTQHNEGKTEFEQDFKELNVYLDVLCKNGHEVKDAGHTWIAFSDKFRNFKERILAALPSTPPPPVSRTAEEIREELENSFQKETGLHARTYLVKYSSWLESKIIELYRTQPEEREEWTPVNEGMPAFGRLIQVRGWISWKRDKAEVYFIDELTPETETLEYGQIGYLLKDRTDIVFCSGHFPMEEVVSEYVTHWRYLTPVKK